MKIKINSALIKTKSPFHTGLFCLLLLLSSCSTTDTPTETTRLFWNAFIANNLEVAQNYVTESSRQLVNNKPDWNLQNSLLKIGEIRINDEQATVQTVFKFPQKKDQKPDINITTYLMKENKVWKVNYQKTTRMFPGKAFRDLMQSLENLTQSYKKKLEEHAPLIEEKIESLNKQLIESIDELNRQLQKPEVIEKQEPSTQSI